MLPLQLNQNTPQPLTSALSMDPSQHLQLQPPQQPGQQQPSQPAQPSTKRRKRADGTGDDAPAPSEPRRLRRSHEACARCRSKKIKASPAGRHRRQFPSTFIMPFLTFLSLSSVTRSTQDVVLAQLPVRNVSKRIATVRLLLPEATQNALSTSLHNARLSLNARSLALRKRTLMKFWLGRVSTLAP